MSLIRILGFRLTVRTRTKAPVNHTGACAQKYHGQAPLFAHVLYVHAAILGVICAAVQVT